MKFTLITDDVWSSKKITYEFDEKTLPKILENFENFLRANGFEFDGYLDFVTPEEEITIDDYSWPDFHDEEFTIKLDDDFQTEPTVVSLEKCPVCYIDKKIMSNHECFDSKCPKDTW